MNKDYDKIKHLFESSLPELTPDNIFIQRIKQELSTVEAIKNYQTEHKHKIKKVAFISASIGFACGVCLTFLYPLILNMFDSLLIALIQIVSYREFVSMIISWIFIAVGSVGGAICSYNFLLPGRQFFKVQ